VADTAGQQAADVAVRDPQGDASVPGGEADSGAPRRAKPAATRKRTVKKSAKAVEAERDAAAEGDG